MIFIWAGSQQSGYSIIALLTDECWEWSKFFPSGDRKLEKHEIHWNCPFDI